MTPQAVADAVELELAGAGTPERARQDEAYLKTDLSFLGVAVPRVRRVARAHLPPAREELLAVVEALWRRPVHECRLAAVELLVAGRHLLGTQDAALLERLLRDAGTWALVDPLAIDVVGPLAERVGLGPVLDRWAGDEDVWLRRSALLSQLLPLRRGDGDPTRFLGYADALLDDRTVWVRKAIGWVLRDAGRRRPELVAQWLLPRAARASGVTVREAVRHLPAGLHDAVLAAARTPSG